MGYLKSLGTGFVWICTFLAAITFIPGIPPTVDYISYKIRLPKSLDRELLGNLNDAEVLLKGKIKGPESFDVYDNVLYTTMYNGEVSKWDGNKFVKVVKFGEKCEGPWEEDKCGRPLGLKFDKNGNLYVADAYYGIFKVDVKTGKYEKIVDISEPIEGKPPLIPNSVDVDQNGNIYWTDSSTEYKLYDGLYTMLSNPNGRLIRYNAKTKKNEVLWRTLGFANGIKLSKDESFVIVAETTTSRILKYNLKGPRSGRSEILIDGLPGLPDNIHSDKNGNFIVSLVVPANEENPQLFQTLMPHSNLRKMAARFLSIIEIPFKFLNEYYPNYFTKKLVHSIGHFESVSFDSFPSALVLRINPDGKIIDVLSDTSGNIAGISSAFPTDDYLWLGSPFNDYIARIPIEKVFPELKKAQSKPAKVVQQPVKTVEPKNEEKIKEVKSEPKVTTPKPPVKPVVSSPPEPVKKSDSAQKVVDEKPKVQKQEKVEPKKQKSVKKTESIKSPEKSKVVEKTKPVEENLKKDEKKHIPIKDEM